MRPYVTKADVHHTLNGLAAGDDEGNARSDDYQQALDDVRDALDIDIDEDSVRVKSISGDGSTDS